MTAQISDQFTYQRRNHEVVAIERGELFKPEDHGFQPVMLNTACWRGYYCRYAIPKDRLVLATLNIGLDPESPPPAWLGIIPKKEGLFKTDHAWEYPDLNLPLPYTGGIVIGREFIREFYVHMGFHRPHCYRYVIELAFREGRLINATDHSETMEAIREKIRAFGDNGRGNISEFIEDAFSLSFEKKWFK